MPPSSTLANRSAIRANRICAVSQKSQGTMSSVRTGIDTGGSGAIAPAARAKTVLIAMMTSSLFVAYRKRLRNDTLTSAKRSCCCKFATSSCFKEIGTPFSAPDSGSMAETSVMIRQSKKGYRMFSDVELSASNRPWLKCDFLVPCITPGLGNPQLGLSPELQFNQKWLSCLCHGLQSLRT